MLFLRVLQQILLSIKHKICIQNPQLPNELEIAHARFPPLPISSALLYPHFCHNALLFPHSVVVGATDRRLSGRANIFLMDIPVPFHSLLLFILICGMDRFTLILYKTKLNNIRPTYSIRTICGFRVAIIRGKADHVLYCVQQQKLNMSHQETTPILLVDPSMHEPNAFFIFLETVTPFHYRPPLLYCAACITPLPPLTRAQNPIPPQ
ncbi:hypothetical protein KQX54_017895 [Cotesia glomerata]|uniref:Uncharacterized protein n=1 Tax=Cotesia glomerata TaxID=32391 RepID=A0AAV7IQY8_COTGL|nr:hypothetical protein KQX54_017895 [Cotesia glomerata]